MLLHYRNHVKSKSSIISQYLINDNQRYARKGLYNKELQKIALAEKYFWIYLDGMGKTTRVSYNVEVSAAAGRLLDNITDETGMAKVQFIQRLRPIIPNNSNEFLTIGYRICDTACSALP